MNPYWGKDFIGFFITLGERFCSFVAGSLPLVELASDELQLLTLVFASISLGLIGTFVVVNRMSMLANSLSHTVLLGIVVVYVMLLKFFPGAGQDITQMGIGALFLAALFSGAVTVTLSFLLKRYGKLPEDASIGLVFTTLFALGIILVTLLTKNTHLGIEVVMGDIEAVELSDARLVFGIMIACISFIGLFYHRLLCASFDQFFASSIGFHPSFMLYGLLLLCSLSIISSFRSIGVILVLSLLTAPPLIARLFTKKLASMLKLSCAVGIVSSGFSVALSRHILSVYHQPVSIAGLYVTLMMITYLTLLFFKSFSPKNLHKKHFAG